ncbi:energy-coupling factor ABC transporter ATP-binding protein [Streptantibioticus silvisoli]|uniref:ABC transporter ATP-binding protein n=1 Tax=Streptantibioticus silvisoli TaxID=2705255 RepID=A0ABT6VXP5_9ACTN|nr:ABC transporter ATP-binding protein [Streptantibioticus silvisoli]MDI5963268.1 ABC transporter ATP-binding protein [Streptantibioticus silvisoli]
MILRIDSLTFRYPNGTTALDGVSFGVEAGERVALVGPNGAGKSTLARHLIGIERPASGTIEIDGRRTDGLAIAELARTVGFVFQNPDDQLHASSVAKEVGFGPRNLRFAPDRRKELVESALRRTGLTDLVDAHPHHLSLGERKRVALASVLAMDTPVVVLDEPTTGQDHRSVALLGNLVDELAAEGRTVLAVTHDMDFCAEHFDRVIALEDGRIVADGPVEHWLARASRPTGHAFELPQLTRLGRRLGWQTPVATVEGFLDRLTSDAHDTAEAPAGP